MKSNTSNLFSNKSGLKELNILHVEKIPPKSKVNESICYVLKKNKRKKSTKTIAFMWKSDLVYFNIRKSNNLNEIKSDISLIQHYLNDLDSIVFVESYPGIKDSIAIHQRIAYTMLENNKIKFSLIGLKEKYLEGEIKFDKSVRIEDIENEMGNQIKAAIAQQQYDKSPHNELSELSTNPCGSLLENSTEQVSKIFGIKISTLSFNDIRVFLNYKESPGNGFSINSNGDQPTENFPSYEELDDEFKKKITKKERWILVCLAKTAYSDDRVKGFFDEGTTISAEFNNKELSLTYKKPSSFVLGEEDSNFSVLFSEIEEAAQNYSNNNRVHRDHNVTYSDTLLRLGEPKFLSFQKNEKTKETAPFASRRKAYGVPTLTGTLLAAAFVASANLLPSSITSLTYIAFLFAGASVSGVTITASGGVALGIGFLVVLGVCLYRNKNSITNFLEALANQNAK